jgi:hypothetical protein
VKVLFCIDRPTATTSYVSSGITPPYQKPRSYAFDGAEASPIAQARGARREPIRSLRRASFLFTAVAILDIPYFPSTFAAADCLMFTRVAEASTVMKSSVVPILHLPD